MCINYQTVTSQQLSSRFNASLKGDQQWGVDIWQDYLAPIVVGDAGGRVGLLAQYSMIPKQHIPPGVKRFSTMNARAETVATLRSFAQPWRDGQLCLVPMMAFYEPCYESGKAERWRISRTDEMPFAVAGLFRSWPEADGSKSYSFTQITINADTHPVMNRFQKPEDEKRSLVLIPPEACDEWLQCRNPEQAKSFLLNCPPELIHARPEPKTAKLGPVTPVNGELF
jgi:putative SOS response-associated peptidase YedK